MTILIKGGRILDPATKTDDVMDLFIEDGAVSYTHLRAHET